jgi:anti-anti-sigma factor
VINTDSAGCRIDKKTGPGFLYLSVSGRLDTITAPNMLAAFEESSAEGKIEKITIDCKNLEYISSAGLRVLIIMLKALKNPSDMTLKNVTGPIMDILESTGFANMIPNISRY